MKNAKFTLAIRSAADVEGWPCVDIFTLKANGEELCDIHFAWSDENENQSCKIVSIKNGFQAVNLPFISSPFQLVGVVQTVIDVALQECGAEFYACAFYLDDENATQIELPIDFEAYKDR